MNTEKLILNETFHKTTIVRIINLSSYRFLSAREKQILQLAAYGLSNKLIAPELKITQDTIYTHYRTIVGKLEGSNMKQSVAIGMRNKLII